MPETMQVEKTLAEATTKFVDVLHHIYSGIKITPIANYEDEDFTFEITIPKNLCGTDCRFRSALLWLFS